MSAEARDPREIITPDAFSVAPELLGTPLARPWRRAAAMAIDLIAIAVLGSAGWFFLGLAIAFLLFRAALRRGAGLLGRSARVATFGSLAVLVLAVTLSTSWSNWFLDRSSPIELDVGDTVTGLGLRGVGGAVADVVAMSRAKSQAELREAATTFAERMKDQGLEEASIREALAGIAAERDEPWADDAIRAALTALDSGEPVERGQNADSLALAYAAAVEAGDSAAAAALRSPLGEAMAAGHLASQTRRIESLEVEKGRLERELEDEKDRGLVRTIFRIADEVGLGFGWAGLYFTFFVALWGGRTPGKKLLGIRIVRLDGKRMGAWASFNRFGGYAASIFTGLLGFFEMFWDRNRQALHDRIAATVVVRETR